MLKKKKKKRGGGNILKKKESNIGSCPQVPVDIRTLIKYTYGVSVSQLSTDMFRLSQSQSDPFLLHDLSSGL